MRASRWLTRKSRRELVASIYLKGDGIEIGALHLPLPVPRTAHVRYVDRMSATDLKKQYPDLAGRKLVDPDIIDDGERLSTIKNGSLDFVIANHFIEHCEDPIFALANMLRVLKPSGMLYLAVPDKRFTDDRDRAVTPIAHLMHDFEHGPKGSRTGHYKEWVTLVNKKEKPADIKAEMNELMAMRYSIHFHAWTFDAFLELLVSLKDTLPAFGIVLAWMNDEDGIFILQRADDGGMRRSAKKCWQ